METKVKLQTEKLNERGFKFYQFIVKEGVWDIFVQRLKESWNNDEDELYKIMNKELNPINSAFIWFNTPEGYFFWKKLSYKWTEYTESYSEE